MKGPTSKQLLLLTGLVSASAFSLQSNPRSFAKPQQNIAPQEYNQYLPPLQPISDAQSASTTESRVSYDFGIGKNKPVVPKTDGKIHGKARNIYQVAEFWSEHDAVNEIPNPLVVQAAANKPRLAPIVPLRLADDYLSIHHDHSEEHSQPTMTAKAPVQEYDLNTPWVEMLIHEQQVKFA